MIPIAGILARLHSRGLLAAPSPETDLSVTGISVDSRSVRAGDLYCAIRGYAYDGHDFLKHVAEAGATAALVETPDDRLDLPQFRVTDARRAAAIAACVVFGEPGTELALVGVTGTNGKTTTVHLARHVLSGRLATGSLGTLGAIDAAGAAAATGLTTPGPIEFARLLSEFKAGGAECVVAEVSSHALSQGRVDGVEFEVGVFTNLSRDHLDYHADFEAYLGAKLRLADLVSAHGALVLNADDAAWSALLRDRRRVTYGLASAADYGARNVRLGPTGSQWTLVTPEDEVEVNLPLIGEFNVSNALAAAAAAGALGIDSASVAERLWAAPSVPGRLEILAEEPIVVRDYAHTPDALSRALAALRPLLSGRLIALFGCGGDRDPGKRPLMGRAAAEGADFTIVTSDNPRNEEPEAIIREILPGLEGAPHERIVDRRAAIARAIEIAEPGDAVLLAGKGHEVYQIVGDERRPFDEAAIVGEILGRKEDR